MSKDYTYIAAVEKAIAEKYGKEAVQDFKSTWDKRREEEYLEQLRAARYTETKHRDREEAGGFLVSKRVRDRNTERSCPVCKTYSFSMSDDVYMSRFECCFECYVQHVEGREERWSGGWRPENEHNQSTDGEKG